MQQTHLEAYYISVGLGFDFVIMKMYVNTLLSTTYTNTNSLSLTGYQTRG